MLCRSDAYYRRSVIEFLYLWEKVEVGVERIKWVADFECEVLGCAWLAPFLLKRPAEVHRSYLLQIQRDFHSLRLPADCDRLELVPPLWPGLGFAGSELLYDVLGLSAEDELVYAFRFYIMSNESLEVFHVFLEGFRRIRVPLHQLLHPTFQDKLHRSRTRVPLDELVIRARLLRYI